MTAPSSSGVGSGAGPLDGVRVVVTRAAHQAGPTVEAFEAAGARVERLPLLEVVPPDDPRPFEEALAGLRERPGVFAWVAFTSANAVDAVFERIERWPGGPDQPRIASVGGATSDALRARGIEPDLEADESRAEGLAMALASHVGSGEGAGTRAGILLPQAADARPTLEDELAAAGARPLRVAAYAKRVPTDAHERALSIFGTSRFGWVTFTSPSIARAFAGLWGGDWESRRRGLFAVSIGPVTSAALRELGVEPAAEADEPGDEEMVDAVVEAIADRGLGRA